VVALNANGIATISTSTLSPGSTHTLTATYAGNTSFAPSTSASVALIVYAAAPVSTTTALTATPNPPTPARPPADPSPSTTARHSSERLRLVPAQAAQPQRFTPQPPLLPQRRIT
jgi:hypothetical protein